MTEKTTHFFKTIGFTPEEIETIRKKAGKNADILPAIFMRQLERNRHLKIPNARCLRKMSPGDFVRLMEKFRKKVLKDPLKAAAEMAKGNILREK